MREKFSKPALSFGDQLELLISRGLQVKDKDSAESFLEKVNYYRFSAYCIPFEKDRHEFIDGTNFNEIVNLYEFDRKLRSLVYEALGIIETALRTGIAYEIGNSLGAFGQTDSNNFYDISKFHSYRERAEQEADRSKEKFVTHFSNKYSEFPDLPIWAEVEIISFGCLSTMYSILNSGIKRQIAKRFFLPAPVLESWLHTLVYVRNICAHHGRLWNKGLKIYPKIPHKIEGFESCWLSEMNRIWTLMLIISFFFKSFSYDQVSSSWKKTLQNLIKSSPEKMNGLDVRFGMGLPENWLENPLWKA